MKKQIILGGGCLPFFYEIAYSSDLACAARQMKGRKFDVSLIMGIAKRCRYGHPMSIVCTPLRGNQPFPTSFWLTCPYLVRSIGTLESKGGVGKLEAWIEENAPAQWIPFNLLHQRVRLALLSGSQSCFLRRYQPETFKRLRSGGIGGIRYGKEVNLKCLHLQTASWLGLKWHPGEKWLKEQNVAAECGGSLVGYCGGTGG